MATILCKVGNHHVHDDDRRARGGASADPSVFTALSIAPSRVSLSGPSRVAVVTPSRGPLTPSSVRHRRSAYRATVEHRRSRQHALVRRHVPPFTAVAAAWSAGPGRFFVPAPIFAETMFQI